MGMMGRSSDQGVEWLQIRDVVEGLRAGIKVGEVWPFEWTSRLRRSVIPSGGV